MAYQDEYRGAQAQAGDFEHLIGFTAEDSSGEKVGTLKAVWEDDAGQPAYLGVATGWLGLGRIHVIPAEYASVSERGRRVRLPFAADVIKDAPDFEADYDITREGERSVREYYRGREKRIAETGFNPDPGDPSLYTGRRTEPTERADWSARTDAPMAYGEAIGKDQGLGGPDRSLAEPETIEEEPEARDEERRGLRERFRDAVSEGKEKLGMGRDEGEARESGTTGSIPLKEETLDVGKREVEAGGVRLRKVIRTEQVQRPVELKREDIEIERVPAEGRASAQEIGEDEIFIPLRREIPEAKKGARVREEIKINKKTETDRESVREDLRKEDVDIDREDGPLR